VLDGWYVPESTTLKFCKSGTCFGNAESERMKASKKKGEYCCSNGIKLVWARNQSGIHPVVLDIRKMTSSTSRLV
jgi:hypothetical protein